MNYFLANCKICEEISLCVLLLDTTPDIANYQIKQSSLDAHLTSEHICCAVALQEAVDMAMDATIQIKMNSGLKAWEGMTAQEINSKLLQSEADIAAGHVCTQDELDRRMKGRDLAAHPTQQNKNK